MRTPFGKMGGTLKDIYATDLAAMTVKALVAKTGILEKGGKVDSVMCGSASQCAHSWSPARYIAMAAGLPMETSASYVEMQCGPAIDSINHAAWKIMAGAADVVIAGGMESHSNKHVKFSTTVQPYKGIGPQQIIPIIHSDPKQCISMIEIADIMAEKWGITRTLARELGRKNVRMNCVAPGYIDTEMMRAVGEEKFNAAVARHPMQRMAQPEEIASVVAFLCTEDASWISGQTIMASGGAVSL